MPYDGVEELKVLCEYAERYSEGRERRFVLTQIRTLLIAHQELLNTMPDDLYEALNRVLIGEPQYTQIKKQFRLLVPSELRFCSGARELRSEHLKNAHESDERLVSLDSAAYLPQLLKDLTESFFPSLVRHDIHPCTRPVFKVGFVCCTQPGHLPLQMFYAFLNREVVHKSKNVAKLMLKFYWQFHWHASSN